MKSKIRNFLKKVMSIFKIKNVIVFESNADYSDNSRAFYEYLIKNNYNEKYKIYKRRISYNVEKQQEKNYFSMD